MDKISLVRPSKDLEFKVSEYRKEHFEHDENEINGSELWDKMDNYDKWLEKVSRNTSKDTVNPNWVVADTFFAIREHDEKIVGIIDFRHELNVFLENFGHISYSVRPSERGKGYATEMLRLVLEIARQIGLKEIQLSCKKDNIPSVKTITKNGGIYNRSFQYNGETANVYVLPICQS